MQNGYPLQVTVAGIILCVLRTLNVKEKIQLFLLTLHLDMTRSHISLRRIYSTFLFFT